MRLLAVDDQPSLRDDCGRMLPPEASPTAVPVSVDYAPDAESAAAVVERALMEQAPVVVALVAVRDGKAWDAANIIRRIWAADGRIEVVACPAPETGHAWSAQLAGLLPHDRLAVLPAPFDVAAGGQLLRVLARKWQLARSEEEGFEQVFNASPLPQSIIALDTFEVITVNRSYEKMIGYTATQLKGTTPESFGKGLNAERWRNLLRKLANNEPVDEYSFTFEPAAGRRIDMRCSARALRVRGRPCSIWVIRDVTEQLRLEEQARQSQKLEAVGQLASGVAHDFNNLLTAIQGFTAQAIMDTGDSKIRSLLEPVLSTARRAATLTRQLLIFGRQQPVDIHPIDLSRVARDLRSVLTRLMADDIQLVWDLPEAAPAVMADVTNMEQVILNLVLNARDALPKSGGIIRVSIGQREFATDRDSGHADGRAGRFVTLEVADNGSGIPPETMARIFEPFFTTKPVGKGTGLGLSTVYSAVRQHKGWVDVKTEIGKGTRFTIFQPVADAAQGAAEAPQGSASFANVGPIHNVGRVLAVDDDPSVQAVLRLFFDRYGIESRIAPDGPSALQIWNECIEPFDVLLTDMVMPNGLSGSELARQLRQKKPDLRVVLMTGYSSDLRGLTQSQMAGPRPNILVKPFELMDVLKALTAA